MIFSVPPPTWLVGKHDGELGVGGIDPAEIGFKEVLGIGDHRLVRGALGDPPRRGDASGVKGV